jgi:PAS domain S-box-containing protein
LPVLVRTRKRDSSIYTEVTAAYGTFETLGRQLGQFVERMRTEEALRGSEARLSAIIESAMDAIIAIDEEHLIRLFNPAAERMFCCSAPEAIGLRLDRFIPEPLRGVHAEHIRLFAHTGVSSRSMGDLRPLTALRSDGEVFPIEATISQATVSGRKLFTVLIRDITARRKAESQIEASLREKESLLKEIHHRVKNNMQVISSLLSLQLSHVQDECARRALFDSESRVRAMAVSCPRFSSLKRAICSRAVSTPCSSRATGTCLNSRATSHSTRFAEGCVQRQSTGSGAATAR